MSEHGRRQAPPSHCNMLLHSDSEGCHLDIRTEEALTEHFAEERRKPGINLRSTISSTSSSFLDEISRPQDIFQRYCPISQWIRPYVAYGWRTHLLNDISAGLVIGIMLIPQAMAYAMIASLPPHYGFYSSIVPSLVYMAMGTSRHVQMGVNAPISLMVAVSISSAGADTEEQRVAAALAITALGSVVYLVMMLLRLDLVSTFIPDPVMSGFCTAMAIQIMTTNLKYAVGVSLNTDNVVSTVADLVWKLPQVQPVAVAFFACGCVGLQGTRSLARRFCPGYTIPEQVAMIVDSFAHVSFDDIALFYPLSRRSTAFLLCHALLLRHVALYPAIPIALFPANTPWHATVPDQPPHRPVSLELLMFIYLHPKYPLSLPSHAPPPPISSLLPLPFSLPRAL
mmetsp:Transcript_60524/g.161406  ORF Transcript_60524/g.161406 Transcript_60524/m.161406 type:complete len:397 (-) Transcript_60524:816-2006(-)